MIIKPLEFNLLFYKTFCFECSPLVIYTVLYFMIHDLFQYFYNSPMAVEHLMDYWKFYIKGSGIQHVDQVTTLIEIITEMWFVKNWDLMKAL